MGTPGDLTTKLILQVKPVDVNVDAGAQIQQLVNVECVDEFLGKPFIFFCSYCNYFFFPFLRVLSMSNVDCFFVFVILEYPTLTILFLYNGVQQRLSLKLPLTINKFFEPTEMNSEAFFTRWKNLSGLVA